MAISLNTPLPFRFRFLTQLPSSTPPSSFPLSNLTLNSPALNHNHVRSSRFKFPPAAKLPSINCDYTTFEVRDVSYQPPGTQLKLLNSVSFSLPEKSFGLIFGQSGSGKTTLLQLLAGISKPTTGSIYSQKYGNDGNPIKPPEPLSPERVGIVFQFPERYFLAENVLDEVTFGWPRQKGSYQLRENLALGLQRAINWVGLNGISLDKHPHSLSGGYKRRLALAIQLVQIPDLLILDEPLAGLDWKARADVVKLLKHLKKELTVLVVSHDLREFTSLVDRSWKMEMGGNLREESLPL
ncbi:ABC transporter I member 11, chloroplastic [Stylosanthes scabra]|uniref:ABC transporter I member 11, chloroplastic n=1 Tax=Stylosanthes scabra TaxID=79078 RepID=A0ABU6SLG1_9FABA|nr:ABC transporter I member 11, chloroplastic [Stylosanthes scabra]